MEITVTQDDSKELLSIEGRLDTLTAPELKEVADKLEEQGVKDIELDLADCEFISSAGLRVIAQMLKHTADGGSLVVRNVQSDVMDVFEMTGFDKILTIE